MMVKLFCIAVLLASLAGVVHAETVNVRFERANDLFDEGRYVEAVASYRAIEDAGYRSAELDFNLGAALYRMGSRDDAAYYFVRAARLRPNNADFVRRSLIVIDELGVDRLPSPRGARHVHLWWGWAGALFLLASGVAVSAAGRGRRRLWAARGFFSSGILLFVLTMGASASSGQNPEGMVIRGPASTYSSFDTLGAEPSSIPSGEVVRVLERRGARVLVRRGDGTVDWIDHFRVREF